MVKWRRFAVSAAIVVACGWAQSAGAQRPIDPNRLESVNQRWLPPLPEGAAWAAILTYVRTTPAALIDPELEPIGIGDWLANDAYFTSWIPEHCEDLKSDIPGPSPELCVSATAAVEDNRSIEVVFAVAQPTILADGAMRWQVHGPVIRRIRLSIETPPRDSLDIPSLRDLDAWLRLPREKWPMVDLRVSIEAKPSRALPGDLVTFVVRVLNAGNRNVDRAEIHASLGQCCGTPERSYDWFPSIPAGHTATVEFAEYLPEGRGVALAHATPYVPDGSPIVDRNPDDNNATIWAYEAGDPPSLGARPPD